MTQTTPKPKKAAPKTTKAKTPTSRARAKPAASAKAKAAPKSATTPERARSAPTAAPEASAAAPKVTPVVVRAAEPTVAGPEMRKEQLLDEVAKRSGAKRKDVKPVVEAMLEVLGEALGDARELNLKPLGKVKVARTKLVANGRVIQLRLRQSDMVIKELEGKAEAAE